MKPVDQVKGTPSKRGWVDPGERGRRANIDKHLLKVDFTYQRREVSRALTLDRAKNFSWAAFHTLVVAKRADGSLYVIDGHQRLLAALLREDVQKVPCEVFDSTGVKFEACSFVLINSKRSHVKAVYKFVAAVEAGIEPQATIAAWLAKYDIVIEQNQKKGVKVVDFPTTLIETWKDNQQATKTALHLQLGIEDGEPLNGSIHRGLWYLEHRKVPLEPEHIASIIKYGGKRQILRELHDLEILSKRHGSDRVCARAVLNVVNTRRRAKNQLQMPEE